jgi:hypothetical protein
MASEGIRFAAALALCCAQYTQHINMAVPPYATWSPSRPRSLGFNAVYHLTDVPGFVSGENLVIFDPHCRHLPSVSASNPGKKIDFTRHDITASFADQVGRGSTSAVTSTRQHQCSHQHMLCHCPR